MTTCGNCCHQVVEVVEELTGTGRVRAGRTGNDSTGRMGAKSAETPKTLIIIIISYLNLIKQEKYWPYVPIMRPRPIESNWTGTQSFVITFYYLLAINFGYFQWFWFVLFQTRSVQTFQSIILIYRKVNFVSYHWGCTTINHPLSYPLISLFVISNYDLFEIFYFISNLFGFLKSL